jgi:pyrroloquinoline quinone biosynthesis protein A
VEAPPQAHENHEAPFMIVPYGPAPHTRIMTLARARLTTHRRHTMKWETPEAIDMRFGMEITMYISNR